MAGTPQTITSADCTITMTVTSLYPSGFKFEEFEAQNIFDMGDTDMAETQRTADGKLVSGFIFGDLTWTFHLQPSSPTCSKLDTWMTAQRTGKAMFRCNMVVLMPALGRKFTCTNGVFKRYRTMPSAGRVLQPMAGIIEWENITAEDYNG